MKALLLTLGCVLLMAMSGQAQTNAAYGDNQAQVEPGVFALYSGDINQDGFIDIFDYPAFETDQLNLAMGYLPTDLNGDGFVDIFDYPVFEANQLNLVSVIQP